MSLNVLIVEDSTVMRSMIKRILNIGDFKLNHIFESKNGDEAIKIMEKNNIDLVFVDINMPVMRGDVLIDKIRENPETAGMAIIVISSESSFQNINKLLNKGVRFVHKPFTPEELHNVVYDLLGKSDE